MIESARQRPARRRPWRPHHIGVWLAVVALNLVLLTGIAILVLAGRDLVLPAGITDRIETRLNAETPKG
ncbi:hypothetical protein LCGC14_2291450, partial [marine sediment metagenome]